MIGLNVKPLSVNGAWKGRRFKTDNYKSYEREVLLKLPPKLEIPEGDLEIEFLFCLSSKNADWDNPTKPLQDILQKKYGFNDCRIVSAKVRKELVKKGSECFFFDIRAAKGLGE